jgi:hypothetical protein
LAVPSRDTQEVPEREVRKQAPMPQQARATVAAVPGAVAPAVPPLPGALGLMLMRSGPSSPVGGRPAPPAGDVPVWLAAVASPPASPRAAAAAAAAPCPAATAAAKPTAASPPILHAAAVPVSAVAPPVSTTGTAAAGPSIQVPKSSNCGLKQGVQKQARAQPCQPAAAKQGGEDVEPGMCAVCWDARSSVCMLPCRHMCCCSSCAVTLQAKGSACPMCRQEVKDQMEVFW